MKGGYCAMKLLSLRANKASFHPVVFKDGINIIVGKQVAPHNENDGNTYNGVGKSLTLHLIHFCCGSRKIDSFSKKIPDWEFTLRFKIDDIEHYCTRSTNNQNKIDFDGELLKPKAVQGKLLELCFGKIAMPANMTWSTLFSRFIRRYRSSYSSFDSFVPRETDLVTAKKELRDRQVAAAATEKAIKNDPLFRQYYLGKNDAELDAADLEYQISMLEKEILEFKVSNNYHELELEADEKSYQKKELENKRVLVSNHIKNIEDSAKETDKVKEEKLLKIYEAAKVEIPEMVKKSLNEVTKFHGELLETRNTRLRKELARYKRELKEIDMQITSLGKRMDELLDYLNSHGALEEYVVLTKQLSSLQNDLNRIQEYQRILKAYRDTKLDIRASMIEQDKAADAYLEEENTYLDDLKNAYWSYAKRFYPKKKSGLVIRNNLGENTLRYTLEARIEDDSSDGVNEVRMFCFDWLLLNCQKSKIKFVAHDSRMFANMDPRQRETLFRIAFETCQITNFQYICSINEDALLSFESMMTEEEYQDIVRSNIILELNDDAPESKLLGVQIDIDLEDKGKAFDDVS